MADHKDWIVIGISGVTCGGKTTLSNRLADTLAPVYVFHQDKYFYPDDSPKHVGVPGMDHNNYDRLSALDMEVMLSDVLAVLDGASERAHVAREKTAGSLSIVGKKFLILEGFTLLNYKQLFDLCTLRYYLTLDYAECVGRRALRAYEPPDVPGYFERCVWPEHERHRAELTRARGVVFVDGRKSNNEVYCDVLNDIKLLGDICSAH